jgi:hypothetical protein
MTRSALQAALLAALAGATGARQPYRTALAAIVARSPALTDPLGLHRAPAPASFLEAVSQRRGLSAAAVGAATTGATGAAAFAWVAACTSPLVRRPSLPVPASEASRPRP